MNNQKRPTDLLSEDHQEVLQRLSRLREIISGLDSQPDMESLKEQGKFFKHDIWAHFAKEEKGLFPEMDKFIPRDGGPVGMMLIEHDDLRQVNEKFQAALATFSQNGANAEAKNILRKEGTIIIDVLEQHIHKEDNILFMMANMHLDASQNKNILEIFARIDREYAK